MNENEKMIMQLAQDVAFIKATLIGDVAAMKDDIKNIQSKLEKETEKTFEIAIIKDRVTKLESLVSWVVKLIVGSVITAVLSIIMFVK